jgi:hypothetical protein
MHEGLLIDVGGVLTTDVIAAFDEYCAREGLLGISIRDLYYNSAEAQRLFRRLELGEIDAVEALHASGVRTGVLSNSWWFPNLRRPLLRTRFRCAAHLRTRRVAKARSEDVRRSITAIVDTHLYVARLRSRQVGCGRVDPFGSGWAAISGTLKRARRMLA